MLKKIIGTAIFSATLFASIGGLSSSASATTVDLSENDPTSGYVAIDDKDKVLFSSSPVLTEDNSNPLSRTAINWANSRWVYYVDNGWNGRKTGHSNYYHRSAYHTSTAQIGNGPKVRRGASAGRWSYATATGYGTFRAWYNAPYR